MIANVLANIQSSSQKNACEEELASPKLNNRGDAIVSNAFPSLAAISSYGNSFEARTTTATAPVTAIPTTATLLSIWNGEQETGKSYIIDSVFVINLAGTNPQQTYTILLNVAGALICAPTATNGQTPRSLCANLPYRGNARVFVAAALNAIDGVAANWFPVGSGLLGNGAITTFGFCVDYNCRGMFVIPPKTIFAVTALSTTATASSIQIGFRWHEVIMPPVV